MSDIVVYDKVSWHYPEGENCPSLEIAKVHFESIMAWLKDNTLLSEEGEENFEIGVDSDFSINSLMLSKKGNDFLKMYYTNWLKTISYSKSIDLNILDNNLNMFIEGNK